MVNDNLRIINRASVVFHTDLPEFRTHGGVVIDKNNPQNITAPTLMWIKALDMLLDRLTVAGVDFSKIAGISGSAQVSLPVILSDLTFVIWRLERVDKKFEKMFLAIYFYIICCH